MKTKLIFLCLWMASIVGGQTPLKGIVVDESQQAIFAANVFLKKHPTVGVTTDLNGHFQLMVQDSKDTMIISFLGFENQAIPLSQIDRQSSLKITLAESQHQLPDIVVKGRDPISEQFSVVKMDKLDIYLNPVAQGDPLKAITVLPSSTTTDESANPSLRGSAADRSRVILNGVPIYNPVRSSQLNNQGFFSLFNPEMISNQYVYASNPPLTYGNTSAGLVEIQTHQRLANNQVQLSAGLANTGVFLSQQIRPNKSFLQAYSNFQFSEGFVALNKKYLPRLQAFYTKDAGINFHTQLNKRSSLNTFHYIIDEGYEYRTTTPSFEGLTDAGRKRYFSVHNFRHQTDHGLFSLNGGLNFSKSRYAFGNIHSQNTTRQVFLSANYQWQYGNWNIQAGSTYDFHQQLFRDSLPSYYYAFAPEAPNRFAQNRLSNHNWETFYYSRLDISPQLIFTSGFRNNIPLDHQSFYTSWQLGLKYFWKSKHSFLLSGGQYHNYSNPNFFNQQYQLQSSHQLALDYSWEHSNTLLKAAVYYKEESARPNTLGFFTINQTQTTGIELFYQQDFYRNFRLTLSNAFIQQTIEIEGRDYAGPSDFDYLLKTTLQYNNPKFITIALTYLSRPGTFYTPIAGGRLNPSIGFFEPQYNNALFSQQLASYHRLDLSASHYFTFGRYRLIAFLSVNNLLNRQNEREVLYSQDYQDFDFDYFQLRSIYFGVVGQLNY